MSNTIADPGHGHSPAAWTMVIIMLVAVTAGTVAFWFEQPILVWASVGLLIVGAIVGWLMKRLGYGVGGSKVAEKAH